MRALVLAAALTFTATAAAAADICTPTASEEPRVVETMARVKDPDIASLGAGQPTVAGCGVWTLEIGADGRVTAIEAMRLRGGPALRGVVEPWLKALTFAPRPRDWTGIMPVTLESGGKK